MNQGYLLLQGNGGESRYASMKPVLEQYTYYRERHWLVGVTKLLLTIVVLDNKSA